MIRVISPLLSILVMAGAFGGYRYHRASKSPEATQATIVYPAGNDREQRALDLLRALGNTQPTPATLAFVVEWSLAEDSGDGAIERNNLWNTTQPGFNETQSINSDGVRGYATWQDGLAATVHTLMNGYYNEVVIGLQTNDPPRAKAGLIASPWAASRYNGGVGWPEYQPASGVSSNPIALTNDDCGWNLVAALNANGGALQRVTIAPGDVFSFNAAMGDPSVIEYRSCAGIPGGNWCNLAARYAQAARAIGLTPVFQDHGVGDLGAGTENSVAIWNVGGLAGFENGSQDLLIQNTLNQLVTFRAHPQGDSIVVVGSVE